tara:strand:- start:278 stop:769 length:492 start_codon:yes stop_codon:yes gene_type:complete
MKNIIFILAITLASVTNAQSLNSILDGDYVPTDSSALSIPILLSMSPQNETPHNVLIIRAYGINPDSTFVGGLNLEDATRLEEYGFFDYDERLMVPFFERGVYSVECLDSNGEKSSEGVTIVINEKFIEAVVENEWAEQRGTMLVSTNSLKIGLDSGRSVFFN